MRFPRMLPVLLGLAALNGCGEGSGSAPAITRSLHYTITDLGALATYPAATPLTIGTTATGNAASASKATLVTARSLRRDSSALSILPSVTSTTGFVFASPHDLSVNNAAQVAATTGSFSPFEAHAALYQAGSQTLIGTLGGSYSHAQGINNSGQIIGAANLPGDTAAHAFLYSGSSLIDIGTLGGTYSSASAINNAGVVGVSDTKPSAPAFTGDFPPQYTTNPAQPHLFVYQNDKISDIGTPGGYSAAPYAINDRGVIVGGGTPVSSAASLFAFTYSNGVYTTLPDLAGRSSQAYAINASGTIAGSSALAGATVSAAGVLHAVVWQNGKITDLGTLPGGNHSVALSINAAGDIVGGSSATNFGFDLGFIVPHGGAMINLNTLVPASSGWTLYSAESISDNGQIVGVGILNNQQRAYLLTPTAAPRVTSSSMR